MLAHMRRDLLALWFSVLAVGLTGCQIGPRAMKLGHPEYASAVREVQDEQLLLNLVRLRYRATPVWLEISSISTQLEINSSGNIGGDIVENVGTGSVSRQIAIDSGGAVSGSLGGTSGGHTPDSLSLGAGVGYSERPTITYTILGGEEFSKRLLTPIPVVSISQLADSGWRSDRVLKLTVEQMNGVKNAPRASGPTPREAPEFRDFQEAVRLMRKLNREGMFSFEFGKRAKQIGDPILLDKVEGDMLVDAGKMALEFRATEDGKKMALIQDQRILMMRVSDRGVESQEVRRLRELLHLQPERARYDLIDRADADYDPLEPDDLVSNISIESRSLMGVMYYLSNAVDVPPEHKAAGPVTETLDSEGNPFDWSEVFEGIFVVHCSKSRPRNAAVAVKYEGYWFYIAKDDENSLSTFVLLSQLASLTAGERKGSAPVLTLPIGG